MLSVTLRLVLLRELRRQVLRRQAGAASPDTLLACRPKGSAVRVFVKTLMRFVWLFQVLSIDIGQKGLRCDACLTLLRNGVVEEGGAWEAVQLGAKTRSVHVIPNDR